jgi:hypothetical protein
VPDSYLDLVDGSLGSVSVDQGKGHVEEDLSVVLLLFVGWWVEGLSFRGLVSVVRPLVSAISGSVRERVLVWGLIAGWGSILVASRESCGRRGVFVGLSSSSSSLSEPEESSEYGKLSDRKLVTVETRAFLVFLIVETRVAAFAFRVASLDLRRCSSIFFSLCTRSMVR